MKKQTAVEWLVDELRNHIKEHGTLDAITISKLKMEAKAMEKQQIEDSAGIGHFEGMGKAPMSSIEYFEYAIEFYQYHYGS